MGFLDSVLSTMTPSLSSIFSLLGYTLHQPLKFFFRIFLLYLAVLNLLSFTLKTVRFSYWRLFESCKYTILVGVLFLHFSNTLGDLGEGILPGLIGVVSAMYVNVYLNDFAWTIGEMYLEKKKLATNNMMEALIGCVILAIGGIYFLLLRSHEVSIWYYVYLLGLITLTFFRKNNSIVTSSLIVLISMIQRYIETTNYSNWLGIILQALLFYIALDRHGKQFQVDQNPSPDQYPPRTYLFFAALQIYLYFLMEPQSLYSHNLYLGMIYTLVVFM